LVLDRRIVITTSPLGCTSMIRNYLTSSSAGQSTLRLRFGRTGGRRGGGGALDQGGLD
jgi:hypothetical protein